MESLEQRRLLAFSASGGEFLVNTFTTGAQERSSVAADADGDFVIAWESAAQDGSLEGIYAQRFSSSGIAQGPEFRVNTYTSDNQQDPKVAMDADGDFVVVWSSVGQDGYFSGIFGRRFNAAGLAQGSEFQINTYEFGAEQRPTVAMNLTGDFVVAWVSTYQEAANDLGIYGQRFDFNGVPQGSEFHINTYTTGTQHRPAAAMDAAGNFVIAWQSQHQEAAASGYGIYGQRFNSNGQATGSEFRINSYTTGDQVEPSVAMDYSGDFVVAWQRAEGGGAGPGQGVYAQRYNASGAAQGSEFRVNSYTTGDQTAPHLGIDADGDFLISWTSPQDGSGSGVYAQNYNAAGTAVGAEFRVNTYTTDLQLQTAVTRTANGSAVISWISRGQDGSSTGVYAQRYQESLNTAGPVVTGVFVNGAQVDAYQATRGPVSQIVVAFSEAMGTIGIPSFVQSILNPANWLIVRDNAQVIPSNITFGFNAISNRYEATVTLSESFLRGNFQLRIRDSAIDATGAALDGNSDGAPGGDFSQAFSVTLDLVPGPLTLLDGSSIGTANRSIATVLMDDAGNATVSWVDTTFSPPFSSSSSGSARRVNADGTVPAPKFGFPNVRTIAMDSAGNYVVARVVTDGGLIPSNYRVGFERFNASNVSLGSTVTYTAPGSLSSVSVDMDSAGNFVIAWSNGAEISAKRFNAAGTAQGSEFLVNTSTTNNQLAPTVVMDEQGDFLVAWVSYHTGSPATYAQRYSATGVAQGGEFRIDDSAHPSGSTMVTFGMDSDGDFVAAWRGSDTEIYARRFDALGNSPGGSFLVNTYTTGTQNGVHIGMDDEGDILIAWGSVNHSGAGYGIYARLYGRDGITSPEFPVIEGVPAMTTAMAMNDAGNLAVFGYVSAIFSFGQTSFQRLTPLSATPTVELLSSTPAPAAAPAIRGDPLLLTASGITGPYAATSVSFYRESNGLAGLQTGPEGDTFISTDTTSGDGWTASAPTLPLAPGTYQHYAQAKDGSGLVGAPASISNEVVAGNRPLVINSVFHYDTLPQKLMFTFDRDVNPSVTAADLFVDRLLHPADPAFTMLPYGTDGTNVVTFVFTAPLQDANYQAFLGPNIFSAGQSMASAVQFDFFFATGDANHDRKIDLKDLVILANNWQGTGKNHSHGDFDYNGVVNAIDLGILAQNWQQGIAAPSPALPAIPTYVAAPARSATRTPTRVIDLVQ